MKEPNKFKRFGRKLKELASMIRDLTTVIKFAKSIIQGLKMAKQNGPWFFMMSYELLEAVQHIL